jgi:hypothetical protein
MLGLCCTQNKIEVEGGPQELAKPQIKIWNQRPEHPK